ncbi:MAG: hypothetical protein MAG551_00091 [Candidatus Scalindua arabica]|uniref:Uncharacterized protein n=1 Tax=Candidatus Scalindua arabica TaxID=1127984 RepID=A0A942A0F8_9BACT|nr:hypothetical protein [Candidatus Scalindua arabica]
MNCLEKKLQAVEDWSAQTNLYELHEVAAGVYVYALKNTADNSEPAHYLCATCFNNKKKSILQRKGKGMGGTYYICNECKAEINDHSNREIPPKQNPGTGGDEHGWMGS